MCVQLYNTMHLACFRSLTCKHAGKYVNKAFINHRDILINTEHSAWWLKSLKNKKYLLFLITLAPNKNVQIFLRPCGTRKVISIIKNEIKSIQYKKQYPHLLNLFAHNNKYWVNKCSKQRHRTLSTL